MNPKSKRPCAIIIWALLFSTGISTSARESTAIGKRRTAIVISLSDIHFNPFFDPSLVKSLVGSNYTEWQAIFEHSKVVGYGPRGADSNYVLLKSAIDNIHNIAPAADFIIIPGDFLAHDFDGKFATFSGTSDQKALRPFINKTIAFITSLIANRFPGTQVYPVIGNNDSDCGDYQLQPNGQFLRETAKTWKVWFKGRLSSHAFTETFPARGSYSVLIQNQPRHRIIVLNTTLFSTNYRNTCGKKSDDSGDDEIKWLEAELQKAAERREKVWLVYHIPPGIDVYSTLALQGSRPGEQTIIPLWQPSYNERFISLLNKYASTIVGSFAGHLHMDTFEVFHSEDNRSLSFVHVTPAISPVYGNNPAFELMRYDRRTFDVTDYTNYFLDLDSPDAKTNVPITWRKEYSFTEAYGQRKFGATALIDVHNLMPDIQSRVLDKYEQYYDSSNPALSVVNQNTWLAYWCGMTNLTVRAYTNCMPTY